MSDGMSKPAALSIIANVIAANALRDVASSLEVTSPPIGLNMTRESRKAVARKLRRIADTQDVSPYLSERARKALADEPELAAAERAGVTMKEPVRIPAELFYGRGEEGPDERR